MNRSMRSLVSAVGFAVLVALLWAALIPQQALWAETPKVEKPDPAVVAADVERAKLLTDVPKSTAEYTFTADQAKIGWDGMQGFAVVKDYFAPGVKFAAPGADGSARRFTPIGSSRECPGKYYLGLWAQTNDPSARTEYSPNNLLHTSSSTDGYAVLHHLRPGAGKAGHLADGIPGQGTGRTQGWGRDRLAPAWGNCQFLRLCLYARSPFAATA